MKVSKNTSTSKRPKKATSGAKARSGVPTRRAPKRARKAEYITYVTNCLIRGEKVQSLSDGRKAQNLIEFSLDGYDFKIIQALDLLDTLIWPTLNGKSIISTRVEMEAPEGTTAEKASEILNGLADLLCFATGSEVQTSCEFSEPEFLSYPTTGRLCINARYKPISTWDGTAVRKFIETTWDAYWQQKGLRKLNVVAGYYSRSLRDADPRELSLTVTFVFLEHLKPAILRLGTAILGLP